VRKKTSALSTIIEYHEFVAESYDLPVSKRDEDSLEAPTESELLEKTLL